MKESEKKRLAVLKGMATLNQEQIADYILLLSKEKEEKEVVESVKEVVSKKKSKK